MFKMRESLQMNKITYFGSESEIKKAISVLKKHRNLENLQESKARLVIQELIDKHHLKASILVNGNTVWSKDRILQNLESIIKHGTLYNPDQEKPPILSHYFYQFLHLNCGSIAHTDVFGWVSKYRTLEDLKKFFKHNEFGKRVLDWIPTWHTDARAIVQQIETLLFPFEAYMRSREEPTKRK